MPISTNAPFNEFGQSQILRDIEQLYLALNGAGDGAPGDGQTQDQSEDTSSDSGIGIDLSGLALKTYVDARDDYVLSQMPSITYPISIANGGTGKITQQAAINALAGSVAADYALIGDGVNVTMASLRAFIPKFGSITTVTSNGTFVVPSGKKYVVAFLIGGGGAGVGGGVRCPGGAAAAQAAGGGAGRGGGGGGLDPAGAG